jgi:hypothetical protein
MGGLFDVAAAGRCLKADLASHVVFGTQWKYCADPITSTNQV